MKANPANGGGRRRAATGRAEGMKKGRGVA